MLRPATALLLLPCLLSTVPALAGDPPRVTSTTPANRATEVAPGGAKIRVVFDRDMRPDSYSFMKGSAPFPQVTGKPSWVDRRTCVLPVRYETLAQRFAGCFVEEPATYARHMWRDLSQKGGFSAPQDRVLKPSAALPRYRGKTAVLIGPFVMSSAEGFVLMIKKVPGCVLVGAPTAGSSGNPKPHDLGNGVTVQLPSWKSLTPAGEELEGRGISPDVMVKTDPAALRAGDPVIAAALGRLKAR